MDHWPNRPTRITDTTDLHESLTQQTYTDHWHNRPTRITDPTDLHGSLTQESYTNHWHTRPTPITDPTDLHGSLTQQIYTDHWHGSLTQHRRTRSTDSTQTAVPYRPTCKHCPNTPVPRSSATQRRRLLINRSILDDDRSENHKTPWSERSRKLRQISTKDLRRLGLLVAWYRDYDVRIDEWTLFVLIWRAVSKFRKRIGRGDENSDDVDRA